MKKLIASIATLLPVVAFAQPITNIISLTDNLTNLGNIFIKVLLAIAVLVIIFNVVRFIIKSDSPEERTKIGQAILWSIVGLFVILSIWGLVRILTNSFNTGENKIPVNDIPRLEYPASSR